MFNVADWNGLDWLLIVVLVISSVRAWMRGLVQALFGLLGFVVGFQLASWNFAAVGDWINDKGYVLSRANARIIAFLVITLLLVIAFAILGHGVKKAAHAVGFGMLDRFLGACFGVARGILIGVAVIVGVSAFIPRSTWPAGSKLSSLFLSAARAVSFVVPYDVHLGS